ncbi:MAG TPA: hypothetical protein EYQ22_01080 [Gammaproteobacteria bacterium]|nr:hypothetical protein [Gammaproteobacteria bacterium]HIK69497.1 hypothetical protein [Pseudomonadales bacterium]
MKTTATEKYNKPYTEVVKILDKGFSDMKKGQKMLISSPKSIAAYIQKIPRGEQRTIKQLRAGLAKDADADNTCPLTAGIFLRIAVEASLEEQLVGAENKLSLPFWRLLSEDSPLVEKLAIPHQLIRDMRKSEGI